MDETKALKNHSMLEEERLNSEEKVLRKFKIKFFDGAFAPVGHVYSVMVEECDIKKPDINGFIAELNEYIKIGGDGYACIKKPTTYFYSKTATRLRWYLAEKVKRGEISTKAFKTIMLEAIGGHDYTNFTR